MAATTLNYNTPSYNNMGVGLCESAGKLPDYESKWDRFFSFSLIAPLRAHTIHIAAADNIAAYSYNRRSSSLFAVVIVVALNRNLHFIDAQTVCVCTLWKQSSAYGLDKEAETGCHGAHEIVLKGKRCRNARKGGL